MTHVINRHGRGKAPNTDLSDPAKAVLKLLQENRWVTDKALRHAIRHVGSPLQTILELLREKGSARNKKNHITSRKIADGKYEYSLVMTEEEEAGMPVGVSDCGKVTMVKQGGLK